MDGFKIKGFICVTRREILDERLVISYDLCGGITFFAETLSLSPLNKRRMELPVALLYSLEVLAYLLIMLFFNVGLDFSSLGIVILYVFLYSKQLHDLNLLTE